MSFRRLWVLVDGLPQDSNVARARHGEAAEWQIGDHLLARIANILIYANSSKRPKDSDLVQPPGTKARAEKTLGAAELDALFTGGG